MLWRVTSDTVELAYCDEVSVWTRVGCWLLDGLVVGLEWLVVGCWLVVGGWLVVGRWLVVDGWLLLACGWLFVG